MLDADQTGPAELDIDPYADAVLEDLESWHRQLLAAAPVVWLSRYQCWAVGRHEIVSQVFSDWERFSSAKGVGIDDLSKVNPWRKKSRILETDPPEHTNAKKAMMRVMSRDALAALLPGFRAYAEELIARLRTRDSFDIARDFAEDFPLKVFSDAIGINNDSRNLLLTYAGMAFNALGPENDVRRRAFDGNEDAIAWAEQRCRREELRPGGFGDGLYQCAEEGLITEDEAWMLVRSLISAGVDTTVSALGASLRYLSENPDQFARLRADPGLARGAFEEAVRKASPVHAFFRTVVSDTEVAGTPLKAGQKIMCVLGAANNDPRKWSDPERYDITRANRGHLAFGVGLHGCAGQMIARMEGEVLLTEMARQVEGIEALGPVAWRKGNALRMIDSGLVRFR